MSWPPDADPAVGDSAFRRALERGDDLVQTLTVAKYALAAGDVERATGAIDAALATSRQALTGMAEALGSAGMLAAALVRTAPPPAAGVSDQREAPGTAGLRLSS